MPLAQGSKIHWDVGVRHKVPMHFQIDGTVTGPYRPMNCWTDVENGSSLPEEDGPSSAA